MVKCLLCNGYFDKINTVHLRAQHQITIYEYREMFPDAETNLAITAETGKKISAANSGQTRTPEQRQHYSEANVRKWREPGYTQRVGESISKAAQGRVVSEETGRKISKGLLKAREDDPTLNRRISEGLIAHYAECKVSVETGQLISKGLLKAYQQNPALARRRSEALTGRKFSEEHLLRLQEAATKRSEKVWSTGHDQRLRSQRAAQFSERSELHLNSAVEEYITLFCEGDGHLGLWGSGYIARVSIGQKDVRRDILEYIASVVPNGRFNTKSEGMIVLEYHGRHCFPLLDMFVRCVVGSKFLNRLNTVLEAYGLAEATQHPLTVDGLVGFWDAEGSSSNAPLITLTQKDREILDLVVNRFGGNISTHTNVGFSYSKSSICHWSLCGDNARTLVEVIASKSHSIAKVSKLLEDFNGLSYYTLHRDKVLEYKHSHKDAIKQYDHDKFEERKKVLEYLEQHPEVADKYKAQLAIVK